MRHCPFFQEGGQVNDCAEYCKSKQDAGSVNGAAIFEGDFELHNDCKHSSLAVVSESVLWVAHKAVADYAVTYRCRGCGLEMTSQEDHDYPCERVSYEID